MPVPHALYNVPKRFDIKEIKKFQDAGLAWGGYLAPTRPGAPGSPAECNAGGGERGAPGEGVLHVWW